MKLKSSTIEVSTRGDTDILDITPQLVDALKGSGMNGGVATLFVTGSTGGLTTVEFEDGLVKDLQEVFEEIAPSSKEYHHNMRWHDGNGHSHVRASLIGPSLTIPFSGGRLALGTWQQVIFIDFDNRPRRREIALQLIGE